MSLLFQISKNSYKYEKLHPVIKEKMQQHADLLEKEGIDLVITSGARTDKEQDEEYQAKATAEAAGETLGNGAKTQESSHEYGLAYDANPRYRGKQYIASKPTHTNPNTKTKVYPPSDSWWGGGKEAKRLFQIMADTAKQVGLTPGLYFKNADPVHFNIPSWKAFRDENNIQHIDKTGDVSVFASALALTASAPPNSIDAVSGRVITEDDLKNKNKEDLKNWYENPNANKPGAFKYGMTWLTVPPQNINISDINNIYTVPTIRTAGSPKTYSDQHEVRIDVQCVFPNLDTVNNEFREILAQFIKVPFVQLENQFLQHSLFPVMRSATSPPSLNLADYSVRGMDINSNEYQQKTQDFNEVSERAYIDFSNHNYAGSGIREAVIKGYLNAKVIKESELWDSREAEISFLNSGISPYDQPLMVAAENIIISTVPGMPEALQVNLTLNQFNPYPFSKKVAYLKNEESFSKQQEFLRKVANAKQWKLYNETIVNDAEYVLVPEASEVYRDYINLSLDEKQVNSYYTFAPVLSKSVGGSMQNIAFAYYDHNYTAELASFQLIFDKIKMTTKALKDSLPKAAEAAEIIKNSTEGGPGAAISDGVNGLISTISFIWKASRIGSTVVKDYVETLLSKAFGANFSLDDWKNGYLKSEVVIPYDKINLSSIREMHSKNPQLTILYDTNSIKLSIIDAWILCGLRQSEKDYGTIINASLEELKRVLGNAGINFANALVSALNSVEQSQRDIQNWYMGISGQYEYKDGLYLPKSKKLFNFSLPKYKDTVITGITASLRNKLVKTPIAAFSIPTYQHLGREDFNITMNIQTTSLDFISDLNKLKETLVLGAVLQRNMTPEDKQRYFDEPYLEVIDGDFFGLLGIKNILINDIITNTDPNNPGLYNISLSIVQADMQSKQYEAFAAYKYIRAYVLEDFVISLVDYFAKVGPDSAKAFVSRYKKDPTTDNLKEPSTGKLSVTHYLEEIITLEDSLNTITKTADKNAKGAALVGQIASLLGAEAVTVAFMFLVTRSIDKIIAKLFITAGTLIAKISAARKATKLAKTAKTAAEVAEDAAIAAEKTKEASNAVKIFKTTGRTAEKVIGIAGFAVAIAGIATTDLFIKAVLHNAYFLAMSLRIRHLCLLILQSKRQRLELLKILDYWIEKEDKNKDQLSEEYKLAELLKELILGINESEEKMRNRLYNQLEPCYRDLLAGIDSKFGNNTLVETPVDFYWYAEELFDEDYLNAAEKQISENMDLLLRQHFILNLTNMEKDKEELDLIINNVFTATPNSIGAYDNYQKYGKYGTVESLVTTSN